MDMLHILSTTFLAAALTMSGGVFEPGNSADPTEAELAYADAPYGVDPMVTGPVSASFREQQKIAGCDAAKWPDVPLACYPK